MQRDAFQKLIQWKSTRNKKPLVIHGARQVGKTWLMKEFARLQFKKVAYINFDDNPRLLRLFSQDMSPKRLIEGLIIESEVEIDPKDTLIIFDEIQECPQALKSLKYFNEEAPEYAIVAAGSLLGVALHKNTSFPVGKVSFMHLYPLSFSEFLNALDQNRLLKLLLDSKWDMITTFKDKYIQLLREYYYVGGMPEAVLSYTETRNLDHVREIQQQLLLSYEQDFSKHAPHDIVPRLRAIWNSIPSQIAKENKKFIYGLVRDGARAKEYELALTWLIDCGLVIKVPRINKPAIPLQSYEDLKAFKLFLLDTGLLGAMCNLDKKVLLEELGPFEEFKGALSEQYICQELVAQCKVKPYYWTATRANAEIDFIVQSKNGIIPLEVKASINLKAKSLMSYREKFNSLFSLRISMSDYNESESIIDFPLYGTPTLSRTLDN